jgi:hypothetical protein
MSLYRCYFWDRTQNTFQMQSMACENDAEAIVMARRMSANSGADEFELWQQNAVSIQRRRLQPGDCASTRPQSRLGSKKAPRTIALGTTLGKCQAPPPGPSLRAGLPAVQSSRTNHFLSATTEVASVIVPAEPSTLLRQACSKPTCQGR